MEWFKRNRSYLVPVRKNWILMQVLQGWKLSAAVNLPACYKIDETYIASKYNNTGTHFSRNMCHIPSVSPKKQTKLTICHSVWCILLYTKYCWIDRWVSLNKYYCGHILLNAYYRRVQCIFHLILYAVGFLFEYYPFFY